MSVVRKQPNVGRLTGVTYDAYVRIRDDPGNRGLRMAYHDGVLRIMSPKYRHEKGSRRISHIVLAYCKAFSVPYEESGSTTFRKGLPGELAGDGKEPDASFYLWDQVALIAEKDDLDLAVDPPPSLWVEVDNRGRSRSRFQVDAGLMIPEVWRYHAPKGTLWFGRLAGDDYDEIAVSDALPGLTPARVLEMLEHGRKQPMWVWDRWLEDVWFPEHRQELIDAGAGR